MNNGYIKLHRKLLSCSIFGNAPMVQLWVWCLLRARHEPGSVTIGRQTVELEPGQFIFGRHVASEELRTPGSTVWRMMKSLEELGMLKIESNNKFSIVTVENWASYQSGNEEVKSKRKRTAKEADTNKNEKNVKNIIPPTLQMIEEYCLAEKLPINPQKFMDYYDSNGWKVGKSKMKDWQATVRSWARREAESNPQPVQEVKKYKF